MLTNHHSIDQRINESVEGKAEMGSNSIKARGQLTFDSSNGAKTSNGGRFGEKSRCMHPSEHACVDEFSHLVSGRQEFNGFFMK